jgi:hypothetical protein
MNIEELDAYNLDDAVKFHDHLNPRLWDDREQLRPEVRSKLLEIAADFEEFLGLNDVSVQDITISGSNAAYSYTDHSDIDLHLVVAMPQGSGADVYRELFDAKKYQYNDLHNIRIGGADVELYVQDADQPHHSQGIYSVKNNEWTSVPRRRSADVNDSAVQRKYQDLGTRIENILNSSDHEQLARMMTKIKTMRAAGLEREGEFGVDNIVFKLLRNNGLIKRLVDARSAARDAELSLTERKRKKKSSRVRYGYGGYWTPGYNFGGTELGGEGGDGGGGGESVREASTPDGVSATTKMFLEQDSASTTDIVRDFVGFCVGELGIEAQPRLRLRRDPAWSQRNHSFGQFDPASNELNVSIADRHVMDILRTVAHELVHHHQQEQQDLPPDAGETGSEYENEANARAGELMRDYGQTHPELFEPGAVSESSGYIPTKKEKNDPRFKMALSPDVQPGATGLNANRMALKTGPQGEPTLLMKGLQNALREFKETGQLSLTEDQDLFEINMSPSNLKKLVRNIDARAGIEFEMIVPDINVEDDGDDLEQDMDMDERVRDIDDVVRFFDDGDYNSARDIRNLREEMYGQYEEWRGEQIYEKWQEEGQDYLRDWIFNNDLFDRDAAQTQAREEIAQANPDMPTDSDEFQDLVTNRVDEMADQFVISALEDQDNGYDDARESFDEEYLETFDEGEWLASEGIRYASDVSNEFSIEWPYYRRMGGGDATMDIDSVAEEFSQAIGRPVNASDRYHGGRREAGHYVVEPDSSLEPDDSSDGGLEFVSPPLPLDELISDMQKVRAWAKKRGCYTNDSTGLHMNVSVPDTSTAKLDYVKLALLLGDERVLNEFGRAANTYTKSALGKIRDILKNKPQAANEVLEKMRGHMEALATKVIHTGNTDKYTSINTKGNYVEFRSPGGDYLDANWELVVPTLMRTVVALDAAMDPEKYREEYQKKLYKLLDSAQKQTPESTRVNKLLSMYFTADNEGSGREAARKLAKELLAKREWSKDVGKPGRQFWWAVWKNGKGADGSGVEVVAATDGEALDKAAKEFGLGSADFMPRATVELLRPYQSPDAGSAAASGQGPWGIWIKSTEQFAREPGEYPVGQEIPLRRFPSRNAAEQWIELARAQRPNMRSDIEVRAIEPSVQNTGSTTSGEWGVWVPSLDRYATIGNAGPRRFETEAAAKAWIEDYHQRNAGRDLNLQASKIVNTFRAFDVGNGNTLGTFRASGPKGSQPANTAFSQYIQSLGRNNTAGFDYDEAEPLPDLFPEIPRAPAAATDFSQMGSNTTGQHRYQIIRMSDRRQVGEFNADTQAEAELHAHMVLGNAGLDSEDYDVRQAPPELIDVPLDMEIVQAPRTLTTPGQPQQTFTGEWKIVDPNGEEIHRFGGIGNVQSDANRVAIEWLRRNPGQMQAGVEVVPVMSE